MKGAGWDSSSANQVFTVLSSERRQYHLTLMGLTLEGVEQIRDLEAQRISSAVG